MVNESSSSHQPRLLTVVTVVFNDIDGLRRTLQSIGRLLDDIEYWIIDGSSDSNIRNFVQSLDDNRIHLLSERDRGLYDAMNKGLDRATSDYVMFLNAGDVYQPTFNPEAFLRGPERLGRVILGYCVERYKSDHYLRPARGQESVPGHSAAHPATAYPRSIYTSIRYDISQRIKADGRYTGVAIAAVGSAFVKQCVCEFELGGRSSSYGNWILVRERIRDSESGRETVALLAKAFLWIVLPRRSFYRLLALGKYEKIQPLQDTHV
jgi:glycosyltransferase involved in cell wall biosynthesis